MKRLPVLPELDVIDTYPGRMPYILLPNQPNTSITIAAGKQAGPFLMTTKEPMFVTKMFSDRPEDNFNAAQGSLDEVFISMHLLRSTGDQFQYSNGPLLFSSIAGTPNYPYYLPQAIFLNRADSILFYLFNNTSGSLTIRFSAGGFIIRDPNDPLLIKSKPKESSLFFYTTDGGIFTTGALTTNAKQPISISSEFDFEIHTIVLLLGTATPAEPYFDLYDNATGESPFYALNGAHHLITQGAFGGLREYPIRLSSPYFVARASKLVLETITPNTDIFLTLGGVAYF